MSWEEEVREMQARQALAYAMGGADKVARQHEFNKLTIRERIDAISDSGSFHEVGTLAGVGEYDEDGQLLTGSYMDYTMPRADDLPSFWVATQGVMGASNPLEVKGVGEVGAIGSPPAVVNAILDALAPLGVEDISMPATSQKVWQAIQNSNVRQAAE